MTQNGPTGERPSARAEPARGHGTVTRLLGAVRGGDRDALDRLVVLLYDDLRSLARRELAREGGPRTLQPTALVHEAYAKLSGAGALQPGDRAHFFAIAARSMRQVLVDQARRRKSAKRGGEWIRLMALPFVLGITAARGESAGAAHGAAGHAHGAADHAAHVADPSAPDSPPRSWRAFWRPPSTRPATCW